MSASLYFLLKDEPSVRKDFERDGHSVFSSGVPYFHSNGDVNCSLISLSFSVFATFQLFFYFYEYVLHVQRIGSIIICKNQVDNTPISSP